MNIIAKYFSNKPMMLEVSALQIAPKALDFQAFGVIPVHGVLTKRCCCFDDLFGTTSYEEIYENIVEALADHKIEQIVLDIDSPGGEVSGLFDLCDFIQQAKAEKSIVAYANDSCFSAAYAIAASCSKILINRTSGVGSIGVIATHLDISEFDKKEGLKCTTIFKGAKKNDLTPHEPLADTALDCLNQELDRLYEMFVDLVSKNRNISSKSFKSTEAGIFYGADAIKSGLADEITTTFKMEKKHMETEKKFTKVIKEESENSIQEPSPIEFSTNEKTREMEHFERYRDVIAEIARLCKLAKMPEKLAEFIEAGTSINDARDSLLKALASKTEDIKSTVSMNNKPVESPVVAAAKSRI